MGWQEAIYAALGGAALALFCLGVGKGLDWLWYRQWRKALEEDIDRGA